MTRKDYEMIAAAFRVTVDAARGHVDAHALGVALVATAATIANGCAKDNPRFDREKFMAACGFTARDVVPAPGDQMRAYFDAAVAYAVKTHAKP